jgi:hypothetical protein
MIVGFLLRKKKVWIKDEKLPQSPIFAPPIYSVSGAIVSP